MNTLSFETDSKKFLYRCQKELRAPAKDSHWYFEPRGWQDPCWATNRYEHVVALIDKCKKHEIALEIDDSAKKEIRRFERDRKKRLDSSWKTDSAFKIPVPDGLSYFPFQRAGIEYAIKNKNTLIADEMGLGKTIESIGVINYTKPKKVLIIVPASLKLNWALELERWLVNGYEVSVIGELANFEKQIVVINYERVTKHKEEILRHKWDLLICDEAHYIKNYKAQRTRAVVAAAKRAKRKIFLTGTPILNRPVELYTPLSILGSALATNWYQFVSRYCGAYKSKWGWEVSGATHLDELNEKLRSTVMVRRLKKDVLKELPAKIRTIIPLEVNSSEIRMALDAEKEAGRAWGRVRTALEQTKEKVKHLTYDEKAKEFETQVRTLTPGMAHDFTQIALVRHKMALAKVPQAIRFIGDTLEVQDKVVVFCHHKDVLQTLYETFSDVAVTYHGDMGFTARQDSIERFQKDDGIRVFLGTTPAAGLGITLTAASVVIFIELEWTPSVMNQAEDRLHRIGQREMVNVYHLVVDGSIDAELSNVLIDKQHIIDSALDDELELEALSLDNIEGRVDGRGKGQVEIERLADRLSDSQITGIHNALKALALMCDYASELDGVGFNKIDTKLGHRLAALESLTPRQAALGYKIHRKYHGQLGDMLVTLEEE